LAVTLLSAATQLGQLSGIPSVGADSTAASGGDLITIAASVSTTASALAASVAGLALASGRFWDLVGFGAGVAGGIRGGGGRVTGGDRACGGLHQSGIPRLIRTLNSSSGRLNIMDLRAVGTMSIIQRPPGTLAIQTRTESTMGLAEVSRR
jgi:hypothetical protein